MLLIPSVLSTEFVLRMMGRVHTFCNLYSPPMLADSHVPVQDGSSTLVLKLAGKCESLSVIEIVFIEYCSFTVLELLIGYL